MFFEAWSHSDILELPAILLPRLFRGRGHRCELPRVAPTPSLPHFFISSSLLSLFPCRPCLPGRPFNPSMLLAQATSNVVCSLIFGIRLPYEDKEFQAVIRAASGTLLGISSPWGQVNGGSFPQPRCFLSSTLGTNCLPAPTGLRDVFLATAALAGPTQAAPAPLGHPGCLRCPTGTATPGKCPDFGSCT